jgi:hypothetical protein
MNDLRPSVNGIITGNLISAKIGRRKKKCPGICQRERNLGI